MDTETQSFYPVNLVPLCWMHFAAAKSATSEFGSLRVGVFLYRARTPPVPMDVMAHPKRLSQAQRRVRIQAKAHAVMYYCNVCLSILSHSKKKWRLLAGAFGYHASRVCPIRPVIIPDIMSSQPSFE